MNNKLGLVLSGGGARGAYGAGFLHYMYGYLAKTHKQAPQVDIITGSSVGAVNGAMLASILDDPAPGVATLCQMWEGLRLSDVLKFGIPQLAKLHHVLLGGETPAGLFDARPLASVIAQQIRWKKLRQNLHTGKLSALSVIATHVGTGQPTVFVDTESTLTELPYFGAGVRTRLEPIGPSHVVASAAIPIVFPSVRMHLDYYCDGGLRFNTPMAPAIHLGADRLLVVGVSTPVDVTKPSAVKPGSAPGAPFLIGKILNAFLLDNVTADYNEVNRINRMLEDGTLAFGPNFIDELNRVAKERGDAPRRLIKTFALRPSADIGVMAGEYMRTHRARFGRVLGRSVLRLLDIGEGADADLASYLLFDGEFARHLMDLARHDAAERRDELADFLFAAN